MIRRALVAAAVVALAVPAVALGDNLPSPAALATQSCKTELSQTGASFKLTYGTNASRSNAFGKCVSKHTATAQQDVQNAAKQCKAEQQADATAFAKKYGSNTQAKGKGAGSNAFGKCVSLKASAAVQTDVKADVAAAKACKTELAAGAAAFAVKYGSQRNAFGKCVSAAKSKAGN
jgi:hypothetical protein